MILDADLRITMEGRNFVAMFGDAEARLVGKRIEELKQGQWNVTALHALLERVVPNSKPFNGFLVEDDFPGLGHRVFKLNARKIFVPGNHVTGLLLSFEDATDAVAADRHKDVIAAELAHRIKNSLSVISAFVAFEVRRSAEPCREGYKAMQTRIQAVASFYDVIAQSSAFGPVDVQAYLTGICNSLRSSLLDQDGGIDIVVEAEPLSIHADHAVPVGLLVNELATNAVKYPFPGGSGRLTLAFRRQDGEVMLLVQDSGAGLESAKPVAGSSGMGTRPPCAPRACRWRWRT